MSDLRATPNYRAMKNVPALVPSIYPWRSLCRLLLAGTVFLTVSGLGVTLRPSPRTGWQPTLELAAAEAQTADDFSQDEVLSYARSVLEMDGYRSQAYTEIKNLLMGANYDVSQVDLACPNTRSLNQVPRQVRNEVRNIVVGYCEKAREIVEANGLSVQRFNEMSAAHTSDSVLTERIYNALIQLQQAAQ
jgi:hypothetical protein